MADPFDELNEQSTLTPQPGTDPFAELESPQAPTPQGQQFYGFGQEPPAQRAALVDAETAAINQKFREGPEQLAAGVSGITRTIAKGSLGIASYLPLSDLNREALEKTAGKLSNDYPYLFGDPEAPKTGLGTAARLVGDLTDPVGGLVFSAVAKYGAAPVLAFAEKKGWLLPGFLKEAVQKELAQGFTQGEKAAVKAHSDLLLKDHVARKVAEGSAGGGVAAGVQEGLRSSSEGNDFKKVATDAASAILPGIVLGSGFGYLGGRFGETGRVLKGAAKNAPVQTELPNSPYRAELASRRQRMALKEAELQANYQSKLTPVDPTDAELDALEKGINVVSKREHANTQKVVKLRTRIRAPLDVLEGRAQQLQDEGQGLFQELQGLEQQGFDINLPDYQAKQAKLQSIEGQYQEISRKHKLFSMDFDEQKALLERGVLDPREQQMLAEHVTRRQFLEERVFKLQKDYENLGKRKLDLQGKKQAQPPTPDEMLKLADQHAKIVDELALVDDAMRSLPTSGLKAQKGSNIYHAVVDDGLNQALNHYDQTLNSKALSHLSAEQRSVVAKAEFDSVLHNLGINKSAEIIPTAAGGIQRQVERASYFDSKLGTRMGAITTDALFSTNKFFADRGKAREWVHARIEGLEKKGITSEQAATMLQYIESGGFNPSAVNNGKLIRPQWEGPTPSPEVLKDLTEIRAALNNLFEEGVGSGALKPEQFIEGYLPLLPKSGAVPVTSGKGPQGIQNPGFAESRTLGYLDPTKHERDLRTIVDRYTNSVYVSKYFRPLLREAAKEQVKLRLLGQGALADHFGETVKTSLNVKRDTDLTKIFAEDLVDRRAQDIATVMKQENVPDHVIAETMHQLEKIWYTTNVTLNPHTNVLQLVQPEATLMPEVGIKNWFKARVGVVKNILTKADRDRYGWLLQHSIKEDLPAFEELANAPRSLVGKGLALGAKGLEKASIVFRGAEKLNRVTAYRAADLAFDDAVKETGILGLGNLTKSLTKGEQQFVLETAKKSGMEAAKNAYALVVDRRVNFFYGVADKPDLLREGAGRYFQFTTFLSNALARYGNDLRRGNIAQFAKRVALPLATADVLSQLTGLDFMPDISPQGLVQSASKYFQSPAISPFATSTIKDISEVLRTEEDERLEKLQEKLVKRAPLLGRYRDLQEKREEGESLTGLKELEESTPLQRAFQKLR